MTQVHKVLMALLIVLGEEPEIVRDWFEVSNRIDK